MTRIRPVLHSNDSSIHCSNSNQVLNLPNMMDDPSNNSGSSPPSTVTVNFKQINATLSKYLNEEPTPKEVKFRPLKPKLLVMNTTANESGGVNQTFQSVSR